MKKFDYFRVRWWTMETSKTRKLEGQNFTTLEEAEKRLKELHEK